MQGDFHETVEEQTDTAVSDGFARQVALHLRLVATEIGKRQEHSANQAGPQVIAILEIEGKIHGVEFPGDTRQVQRVAE